jgi:hypothetical protein
MKRKKSSLRKKSSAKSSASKKKSSVKKWKGPEHPRNGPSQILKDVLPSMTHEIGKIFRVQECSSEGHCMYSCIFEAMNNADMRYISVGDHPVFQSITQAQKKCFRESWESKEKRRLEGVLRLRKLVADHLLEHMKKLNPQESLGEAIADHFSYELNTFSSRHQWKEPMCLQLEKKPMCDLTPHMREDSRLAEKWINKEIVNMNDPIWGNRATVDIVSKAFNIRIIILTVGQMIEACHAVFPEQTTLRKTHPENHDVSEAHTKGTIFLFFPHEHYELLGIQKGANMLFYFDHHDKNMGMTAGQKKSVDQFIFGPRENPATCNFKK